MDDSDLPEPSLTTGQMREVDCRVATARMLVAETLGWQAAVWAGIAAGLFASTTGGLGWWASSAAGLLVAYVFYRLAVSQYKRDYERFCGKD